MHENKQRQSSKNPLTSHAFDYPYMYIYFSRISFRVRFPFLHVSVHILRIQVTVKRVAREPTGTHTGATHHTYK